MSVLNSRDPWFQQRTVSSAGQEEEKPQGLLASALLSSGISDVWPGRPLHAPNTPARPL